MQFIVQRKQNVRLELILANSFIFQPKTRFFSRTNPFLFIHYCLSVMMIVIDNSLTFSLQMFVFLIIDFIRNMKTQMPQIIFYFSLLYNINAAFNKFADDYLDLKSKMFDVSIKYRNFLGSFRAMIWYP